MLKNNECSSSNDVDNNYDFTKSVAFNIAAWGGVFYLIFVPLFFIYCSVGMFLSIFHKIYLPFELSMFQAIYYFAIVFYVLFLTSFFVLEPIKNLKYNTLAKVCMIFCFICFHIVSFCIFVWSSYNL